MIIDFKKKRFSVSSTFLLDHLKAASALFLLATLASIFFLDKSLALSLHALPATFHEFFGFFGKLFCPIAWSLILPALFFYIRFVVRKEKKSRKFWYLSLSIPLTVLLCKILEVLLGRANPEWFFIHNEAPFRFFEWNSSFHSFPCMTTVVISSFGASLACVISNYRLPILTVGFLLSFAPVLSTHGFLSDSLIGIYVGAISAQWIFRKVRREVSI